MKARISNWKVVVGTATALFIAPAMLASAPQAAIADHRDAKMVAHEALRRKINFDAPRRNGIDFRSSKVRYLARDRREVSGTGVFRSAERRGGMRRFSYRVIVNPITDRAVSVNYSVR